MRPWDEVLTTCVGVTLGALVVAVLRSDSLERVAFMALGAFCVGASLIIGDVLRSRRRS